MQQAEIWENAATYGSVRDLERRVNARMAMPGPAPADPVPGLGADPPALAVDRRGLGRAAAGLRAAGAHADALARAEARLDAELVSKVMALATRVLRASRDSADRRELEGAVSAFNGAVSAIGARAPGPPLPAPRTPSAMAAGLATYGDADAAIAGAAAALRRVRELATGQAEAIRAGIELADRRHRAVRGEVEAPEPPSDAAGLLDRAAALAASDPRAAGLEGVSGARAAFRPYEAAEEFGRVRKGAEEARAMVKSASLRVNGLLVDVHDGEVWAQQ